MAPLLGGRQREDPREKDEPALPEPARTKVSEELLHHSEPESERDVNKRSFTEK